MRRRLLAACTTRCPILPAKSPRSTSFAMCRHDESDKSYRNLKVTVDLGNVKVRARKGYYAAGQ